MTNEDYIFLGEYSDHMRTASVRGWARNIGKRDRAKIRSIVENETGHKMTSNIYCSSCLVDLLLAVKPLYDSYIWQQLTQTEEVEQLPIKEIKSKKPRKKRSNEEEGEIDNTGEDKGLGEGDIEAKDNLSPHESI